MPLASDCIGSIVSEILTYKVAMGGEVLFDEHASGFK
jgi:hypothetical protein